MFVLLAILFLVLPLLELYVIIEVAQGVGWLDTIGLLIVISIVGAFLVRREGLGVVNKIQTQMASGTMPGKELVDGGLILFAGALMLTPGFVTDAVGLLLLIPPTRIIVRNLLVRRFKGRMHVVTNGPGRGGAQTFGFGRRGGFMDVDSTERDVVDLERDETHRNNPPSLEQ